MRVDPMQVQYQCLRRWPNIKPALGQPFMFNGMEVQLSWFFPGVVTFAAYVITTSTVPLSLTDEVRNTR